MKNVLLTSSRVYCVLFNCWFCKNSLQYTFLKTTEVFSGGTSLSAASFQRVSFIFLLGSVLSWSSISFLLVPTVAALNTSRKAHLWISLIQLLIITFQYSMSFSVQGMGKGHHTARVWLLRGWHHWPITGRGISSSINNKRIRHVQVVWKKPDEKKWWAIMCSF